MDATEVLAAAGLLLGAAVAFFVSAAAGLGGSLVLVPLLSLSLGSKEGISLAALLLAMNNFVKLWAYRRVLPVKAAGVVVLCTVLGAFVGARLLVAAPARLVDAAVVISLAVAFFAERRRLGAWRLSLAPTLALAAGATSGFSGTSGPLKGVAIRSLGFDRLHTVGAAALASAAADVTKTAVFAHAGLLGGYALTLALVAIPLMVIATFAGRHFTQAIGEKGYAGVFWVVIGGYTVRLLLQAR
jgi:uncharacterized membrane protein YfcA